MEKRSLADRYASSVLRHRRWWIAGWIVIALFCWTQAPSWSSIALDGDFDHLPRGLASVRGEQLLNEAFPANRARSQFAIVIGRTDSSFDEFDRAVSLDVTRRLYHRLGEVYLQAAIKAGWQPGETAVEASPAYLALDAALQSLDQAIKSDDAMFRIVANQLESEFECTPEEPRLKVAYADRAVVLSALGEQQRAEYDLRAVELLQCTENIVPIEERPPNPLAVMQDILSPEDPLVGTRLTRPKVQLVLVRLQTELGEHSNVQALAAIKSMLSDVQNFTVPYARPGLRVEVTGSAAVGAESHRASADAIRYTEAFTILLVLLILAVVYRAPLLVAVPITSIALAVVVATGLISGAVVGGRALGPGFPHPEVFVTSRIFVFVIVFGAGTDFCLFLIARLREETNTKAWTGGVLRAMSRTLWALVGSALTTIVGLGTMLLATFGKFHHTGPVIAICLLITLFTCITFTPALLSILGPRVFWPGARKTQQGWGDRLWVSVGNFVTHYPGLVLTLGLLGMMIPATYGWIRRNEVTYDFVSQLSPSATSRRAAELLATEFPAGETNPIAVVVYRDEPFTKESLETAVKSLAQDLYLPGVSSVRSLMDPLGATRADDSRSGERPRIKIGLFTSDSLRNLALRNHRVARSYFVSDVPEYHNRLVRFDVVPEGDPFGPDAADTLVRIRKVLNELTNHPGKEWFRAQFAIAGTTASIHDLRTVTMQDTTEIQISVVCAVLVVLLLVVRQIVLSVYLIATVLISYFATLGLTLVFFQWSGGDSFVGLDWKLPLFLFVILVAVGQDYNVYLVTRVLEEVRGGNFNAGLRRAVARTGGIITSCGLVMAGTFFSMTSAAWAPGLLEFIGLADAANRPPTLSSITQLGFALGVGVLLDTFYVRPILVPAFMALTGPKRSLRTDPPSDFSLSSPLEGEATLVEEPTEKTSTVAARP